MVRHAREEGLTMKVYRSTSQHDWSLALHGGTGGRIQGLVVDGEGDYEGALRSAYQAGGEVLAEGGSALDAVCATVTVLEDDRLFNAGCGSALRCDGSIEMDALAMAGTGHAGGVVSTRWARNPVLAARHVMEDGSCVLRARVSRETLDEWGLATASQEYFSTPGRRAQLRNVRSGLTEPEGHGTVGAVARDRFGRLAAATSTGGTVNQEVGRIGDSPIIGAGTYAQDGIVAVSCTGDGEAFMQGVVAHEIAARIGHAGQRVDDAVIEVLASEVGARCATGGVIAVGSAGEVVIAHTSPTIFALYEGGREFVVLT